MPDFNTSDYWTHYFGVVSLSHQRAIIAFQAAQNFAIFTFRTAIVLNSGMFGILALLISNKIIVINEIYCSGILLVLGIVLGIAGSFMAFLNLSKFSNFHDDIAEVNGKKIRLDYTNLHKHDKSHPEFQQRIKENVESELFIENSEIGLIKDSAKINTLKKVAIICAIISYILFVLAVINIGISIL